MTPPVFTGLDHGRMLLANERLGELVPAFEVELHAIIDEILLIDAEPYFDEPIAVAA